MTEETPIVLTESVEQKWVTGETFTVGELSVDAALDPAQDEWLRASPVPSISASPALFARQPSTDIHVDKLPPPIVHDETGEHVAMAGVIRVSTLPDADVTLVEPPPKRNEGLDEAVKAIYQALAVVSAVSIVLSYIF
jgi:hypothetical protein